MKEIRHPGEKYILVILNGQTLSAFGPAAAQYLAAVFGCHAYQKAVNSLSFKIGFIGQSLFHV